MHIKMLSEVWTVGQLLEKGKRYDVQDSLAKALIGRGEAEDILAKPPKPKVPEPKPEITEEILAPEKAEEPESEEKLARQPAKKPSKKPAGKK
jgi:hypothetical protein